MYINTKLNNEVETIDTVNRKDFKDSISFQKELKRVINEHRIAFKNNNIYASTKSIS